MIRTLLKIVFCEDQTVANENNIDSGAELQYLLKKQSQKSMFIQSCLKETATSRLCLFQGVRQLREGSVTVDLSTTIFRNIAAVRHIFCSAPDVISLP
ncbi:hypothetical protein [Paraburkholderia sp. BCC1884]|uniref:hypothetical protein n=1 Tax=Paraburkholderia sp. BCC1884 TaxID=2562668 RepID=UPI0011831805|nr:hypothetical protein [Paraburkholderia sp. BCC1884]